MTARDYIEVATLILAFVGGIMLAGRVIAELRAIRTAIVEELSVTRFRIGSEFNVVHKRLQAIGGTISSDLKDAAEKL